MPYCSPVTLPSVQERPEQYNNWVSQLFHNYFDGGGKKPPPGANPDWGIAPHLKLEHNVSADDYQYFEGQRFCRIHVRVIFRDPSVAQEMERMSDFVCIVDLSAQVRTF